MNRNKLVKEFTAAVKEMCRTHGNGIYYWRLGSDDKNDWAIVLGWADGFEEEPNDPCMSGTWRICAKLAYQPWNSIMQCDYDIDWYMPYDEETMEVDDTEEAIYPDTDLAGVVDWLLKCWETYKEEIAC